MGSNLSSPKRLPALLAGICLTALFLAAATPRAGAQIVVTPFRTQPWRLPESIRNEALVALDRGQEYLVSRQKPEGTWIIAEDGRRSGWPALALDAEFQPEALKRAATAAEAWVEQRVGRVLPAPETLELARGAMLLRMLDSRPDLRGRVARRLKLASDAELDAGALTFMLEARTILGQPPNTYEWGNVIARTAGVRQPGAATLAAWARMARGAERDGRAVQAYLRWLTANWPHRTADLCWLAQLADSLPPAVLHDAGFPLTWRTKMAEVLVSTQKHDSVHDGGFWQPSENATPEQIIEETAYAALILKRIAE